MNNIQNQNFTINQLQNLLGQLNNYMFKINEIILEMNNLINLQINSSIHNLNVINNPMLFNNTNINLNPVLKDENHLITFYFDYNNQKTSITTDLNTTEKEALKIYFNKINKPGLINDYENKFHILLNGGRFGSQNRKLDHRLAGACIELIPKGLL